MKIGFVADAHGNPLGLALCLDLLAWAGAEMVLFLGDAVGYFPGETEVLGLLVSRGAVCLMGNHEAMLLGELPIGPEAEEVCRLEPARRRLDRTAARQLAAWPRNAVLEMGGKRILCMHGRPDDPLQGYFHSEADLDSLEEIEADILVMAHTHHPFLRRRKGGWVANPGSAGLPRQGGGRASCLIYDTECGEAWLLWADLPLDQLHKVYGERVHPDVLKVLRR